MTSFITVTGADWCGDTIMVKKYLDTHKISYTYINTDVDPSGNEYVMTANLMLTGKREKRIPIVKIGTGTMSILLIEPTIVELERALSDGCDIRKHK